MYTVSSITYNITFPMQDENVADIKKDLDKGRFHIDLISCIF